MPAGSRGKSLPHTEKKKNSQVNWTGIAEPSLSHPFKDPTEYYYIQNNLNLGKGKDGELWGSGGLSW